MKKGLDELKKALKDKGLVLGTEKTLKNIKSGKSKKVFVSSNCPDGIKEDITHFCKLANVEVFELDETNEEIGFICKKPFSINVVSV